MDFLLNSDQSAIGEIVQKFLRTELPAEKVRGLLADPSKRFDPAQRELWTKFLSLGAVSACLPEDLGGLGLGLLSASVAVESCQPLNHLPVFQTLAYAIIPLSVCPESEALVAVLESVTSGKALASGVTLVAGEGLEAEKSGDEVRLSGEVFPLTGGKELEVLIVSLIEGDEVNILGCDLRNAPRGSFSLESLETLDLLREYSSLKLEETPFQVLGTLPMAVFTEVEAAQLVLAASDLVGIGSAVMRMTVEYVKTREQFGRPIGSFQAIQHSLADMFVALEQARSLTRFAAWCADTHDAQFQIASHAAKSFASEVIPSLVESAIQAHGGIGFTFESDLHLSLRRAKVQSILLGDEAESARTLATLELGDTFEAI